MENSIQKCSQYRLASVLTANASMMSAATYHHDVVSSSQLARTAVLLNNLIDVFAFNLDEQMADRYSIFGPSPRLPSCMLRSEMLSLEFKVTSFTEWAAQLKINPLYAWFTMLDLLPEATISKVLLD